MPKARLQLLGLLATLSLFQFPEVCIARQRNNDCGSSLCGNVLIKYPFRLKGQSRKCGDKRLELQCDEINNLTTLVLEKGKFHVQEIFYQDLTLRLVDASLDRDDNCSLPLSSVSVRFSRCGATSYRAGYNVSEFSTMFLVNCSTPVNSSHFVDASRCATNSSHPPDSYFYFLDQETKPPIFSQFCTVIAQVPVMLRSIRGRSTSDIYKKLLTGFEMSWKDYNNTCYKLSFHDIDAGSIQEGNLRGFFNRQCCWVGSRRAAIKGNSDGGQGCNGRRMYEEISISQAQDTHCFPDRCMYQCLQDPIVV